MSVIQRDLLGTTHALIIESEKRAKALRRFVHWYETYERGWSDEYRDGAEFMDLREVYDAARAALKVQP